MSKDIMIITAIAGKKLASFSLVILSIFKPIAITNADPTAPISVINI
jgi:hypothetical protein